jgi:hypothetical protein
MNAPAGWYPDPNEPEKERYWDGLAWTSELRLRNIAVGEAAWTDPQLGGLFDEGFAGRGNSPSTSSAGSPRQSNSTDDSAWWLEEAPTNEPAAGNQESYARAEAIETWEPDAAVLEQRGGRKRRGKTTRIAAALLLLLAIFLAYAERQRSEVPPPPVVDNLPLVNTSPSPEAEATEPEDTGLAFDDLPIEIPDTAEPTVPEPVESLPATGSTGSRPSPTPSSQPSMLRVPPIEYYGSSFGPGGLLAVTWNAPPAAPKGVRYQVDVRFGDTSRSVRTSKTEVMFRNVSEADCRVTVTAYVGERRSKPVTFRCGK